jgi:cis-L-3-hydroxyproline dehydratase
MSATASATVTELSCFSLKLPFITGSYAMSHGRVLECVETTVVRVTAEDGTAGYGEACTVGSNYIEGFAGSTQAAVRELAPTIMRCGPFDGEVLVDRMDQAVKGHFPAKAAVDAAFWDLRGKLLGMPVARLLGGIHQHSFPVFHPISLDSVQNMIHETRQMADRGYRHWQLKLGDDPIEDAARLRHIAAELDGKADFITSDANGGWSMAQASRFLAAIEGVDTYVEQPCLSLAELSQIRRRCPLPIVADEAIRTLADLLSCVSMSAADAINLKPARVGGITKAAQVRDVAQASGLMLMIDEPMGGTLAGAGIGHLSASCHPGTFLAASQVTATHVSTHSYGITGGPQIHDGRASIDEQPGLGVDVDPERLGAPLFAFSADEFA